MDRREFFKVGFIGLAIGAASMLAGCGKPKESITRLSNQEKLWQAAAEGKINEPVEPAYAKNTPARYKDASFGKEDASFTPKVGGG
jgi:hypothetical protein